MEKLYQQKKICLESEQLIPHQSLSTVQDLAPYSHLGKPISRINLVELESSLVKMVQ